MYFEVCPFQGWVVVPGKRRDLGPGPANPWGWNRNRDSKPRDSRDWDKNLRDGPSTKIPRDKKSRHFGTRISVSPGTVPLSRYSMWRKSRSFPQARGSIWRAGLPRGTRVPIYPGIFWVPWNRDREKISQDCPAWSIFYNII